MLHKRLQACIWSQSNQFPAGSYCSDERTILADTGAMVSNLPPTTSRLSLEWPKRNCSVIWLQQKMCSFLRATQLSASIPSASVGTLRHEEISNSSSRSLYSSQHSCLTEDAFANPQMSLDGAHNTLLLSQNTGSVS